MWRIALDINNFLQKSFGQFSYLQKGILCTAGYGGALTSYNRPSLYGGMGSSMGGYGSTYGSPYSGSMYGGGYGNTYSGYGSSYGGGLGSGYGSMYNRYGSGGYGQYGGRGYGGMSGGYGGMGGGEMAPYGYGGPGDPNDPNAGRPPGPPNIWQSMLHAVHSISLSFEFSCINGSVLPIIECNGHLLASVSLVMMLWKEWA